MKRNSYNISRIQSGFSATRQVTVDYTIQGQHWIMHEHDADINDPSCPHLHVDEKHWKLDVYTGYIYEYPKKSILAKHLRKS